MDLFSTNALFAISAVFLSVALFIDTSAWWIRSLAQPTDVGLYVSRSNIYLYGGRFFSLAFVVAVSLAIEIGATPKQVAICCFYTFCLASLLQLVCVMKNFNNGAVMKVMMRILILPKKLQNDKAGLVKNKKLFITTIFASFVFAIGNGMPLLFASIFIDYRLSMSNLGQIINSLGMVCLLLFVDQDLFKAIDNGTIQSEVIVYTRGRFIGLMLAAIAYLLVSLIV